jgi:hypothetical protein
MVSTMSYISADVANQFFSLLQACLIHIIYYNGLDIPSLPLASGSKLIILQIILSRYDDKGNDNYNVGFNRILLIRAKGLLGIFALLAERLARSAVCFWTESYLPCICCQF